MTHHSVELIQRVIESYDEYFEKIPDDRLLAIATNPLMATKGFDDIVMLLAEGGEGGKLKRRAKKLLHQYILNILLVEEKTKAKAAQDSSSKSSLVISSGDSNVCARPKTVLSRSKRLKQSKAEKRHAKQEQVDLTEDLDAHARKEVDAFFAKSLTQSRS